MAIYQYDVVFKCNKCGHRISRCREDYSCINCGNDLKQIIENECNKVNSMTMIIPLLIFVNILLYIIL